MGSAVEFLDELEKVRMEKVQQWVGEIKDNLDWILTLAEASSDPKPTQQIKSLMVDTQLLITRLETDLTAI